VSLTVSIIKTVIFLAAEHHLHQQVSTPPKTVPEHRLGKSVPQLSAEASVLDNFLFETMVTKPLLLPIKMQEKDK